jgi:hypothetical protein
MPSGAGAAEADKSKRGAAVGDAPAPSLPAPRESTASAPAALYPRRDATMDEDLPHDTRLWLDRFVDARRVCAYGAVHAYTCVDAATRERRLVLVGADASLAERAREILDALGRAHAAVGPPTVPAPVARDRCGDIEFLALDCDATTTFEALRESFTDPSGPRPSYQAFQTLFFVISEAVARAHKTRDPSTGRPICLGRMSWSRVLVTDGGDIVIVGLGWPTNEESTTTAGAEFVAPEVSAGAWPTPQSDVYLGFCMMFSLLPVTEPSPAMARVYSGTATPEDAAVTAEMESIMARCLAVSPAGRPESVDELMESWRRTVSAIGVQSDVGGLRAFLAGAVRRARTGRADPPRSAGDPTAGGRSRGPEGATSPLFAGGAARAPSGRPVTVLARYELRELLGQGGMGSAHAAYDRQLRQQVVVKKLLGDASGVARERFIREVRVLRQTRHEHLVRGFDLVEDEGALYAIMEFIEGQPLDVYLEQNAAERAGAPALLAGVADGLASLHALGIVHRDVKPSNVVVHPRRGAILVDFGVALERGSDLTRAGDVTGTPAFMSPEQRVGLPAGPPSDVYSLSLVVLAALAGRCVANAAQRGDLLRLPDGPASASVAELLSVVGDGELREALAAGIDPSPERRPSAAGLARVLGIQTRRGASSAGTP